MRTVWYSVWVLSLALSATAAPRDRISVVAALDTEQRLIGGVGEIRFAPRPAPLHDLRFRLYPNCLTPNDDTCGIAVDSVLVNGSDVTGGAVVDGTDLLVTLATTVPADSSITARLVFRTKIPIRPHRFGLYDRQFTLEAWFPYPAPWADDHWQRVQYLEYLEPAANITDVQVEFTFPDSLHLIAPGLLRIDASPGRSTAHLALDGTVDLPLVLTADPFELDSTQHANTNVRVYAHTADRFIADTVREAVYATLDFMAEHVMPYPFAELTVVVGGFTPGGGLEWPRMVLLSRPPRSIVDRVYANVVIHEVIHQWFYGLLASNQADHPWLDESITEHLAIELLRSQAGDNSGIPNAFGFTAGAATWLRPEGRPYLDMYPITQPGQAFAADTSYTAVVYDKGPLILSTLTGLMGEENRWRFWREYAQTYAFASPSPDDFAGVADKYLPPNSAGGARAILDYNSLLDWQVIDLSSRPAGDSASDSSAAPGYVASIRYIAKHPLGFPVTCRVFLNDGTHRDTTLVLQEGEGTIDIAISGPARAAELDPEGVYAIDVNLLNNSLDYTGSRGAALRLCSRLTQAVESLLGMLWGW